MSAVPGCSGSEFLFRSFMISTMSLASLCSLAYNCNIVTAMLLPIFLHFEDGLLALKLQVKEIRVAQYIFFPFLKEWWWEEEY